MNVADWLYRRAQLTPLLPALFEGVRCRGDYAGFAGRAQRVAQVLSRDYNVQPGDRVALYMQNSLDYLACMYGILWAGAVIVPINYKLHAREAFWIVENAQAKGVITDHSFDTTSQAAHASYVRIDVHVLCDGGREAGDAVQDHTPPVPRAPGDLAWLFYTSGTTGRPKGVMLTHQNLAAMSLCYLSDVDDIVPGEAVLYAAPLSHGAGLHNFIHVRMGSRHVVPDSRGFDCAEIIDTAAQLGRLSFFAAPTMVKRLVAHVEQHRADVSGLKTIVCGGAPMYVADVAQTLDVLGPVLALVYGQGESPMTITALRKEIIADRAHPEWAERVASVGTADACVSVRVVDEHMNDLPVDECGEVVVRGTPVMAGYWNNPSATADTLIDGWLRTGDIGYLNAKGFLTLTDRSKDVIISGGSNVYPREVEEVLVEHPAVFEAAVVGEPHHDWGEQVVAFVVPLPGKTIDQADLDDWCKQHIAAFKRPKRYLFCAELPKNSYGKIPKTELRERLQTQRSTGS